MTDRDLRIIIRSLDWGVQRRDCKRSLRSVEFFDTTNTLCASEVKTFTPYFRNTANPGPAVPSNAAYLSGFAGAAEFKLGPGLFDNEGHTEWCDSPVHESGFTTTFGPNQRVEYVHSDGQTYDVDFNSRYEGTSWTEPTYAAVTSRSFHPGLVQTLWMDGSVRSINDSIDVDLWRASSTRSGHEVMPSGHLFCSNISFALDKRRTHFRLLRFRTSSKSISPRWWFLPGVVCSESIQVIGKNMDRHRRDLVQFVSERRS